LQEEEASESSPATPAREALTASAAPASTAALGGAAPGRGVGVPASPGPRSKPAIERARRDVLASIAAIAEEECVLPPPGLPLCQSASKGFTSAGGRPSCIARRGRIVEARAARAFFSAEGPTKRASAMAGLRLAKEVSCG
jgi:hypothetical protein